jgi:hypothetical protein
MRMYSLHVLYILQGNSYIGLWGHVFDNSSKKNQPTSSPAPPPVPLGGGLLADRLHHAAGELRAEAEEVRSRLIQRIGGGNVFGKTAADERESASSFMTETFNQLFGPSNKEHPAAASAATTTENASTTISTTETLSLLDRMQERLGLDGKMDARQLAALAAVQGVALSSLRKHMAAADTADVKSSSSSEVEYSEDTSTSIYDPRHLSFSKLGVALPDSVASHFDGEWCLRLQNFANAAGYRSVYLGGVPCSGSSPRGATAPATTTPATAMLHWNSEAAFSLDCSTAVLKAPNAVPSTENNAASEEEEEESFLSGVSAMLHAARVKASSEFSAALHSGFEKKTMECSLAVSVSGEPYTPQSQVSEPGSGTVLHSSQTLPVFNPHKLNALKIRICNMPAVFPISGGGGGGGSGSSTSTSSSTSPLINLHGLKVNNRHLAIDALQVHPSKDCHVAFIRLPTRALADGFILNGYVTLEKGGAPAGVYNVGEMASVEMQIGSLRLLSTAVDGAAGEETEVEEMV